MNFYDNNYKLALLSLKEQVADQCVVCQVDLPAPPATSGETMFLEGLFQGVLIENDLRAIVMIKGDSIIAYPLFDE